MADVRAFIDDMGSAYGRAALVVSRAGAMSCAEITARGLPAVLVPLPIGNGEQALNARAVIEAGGGLLVDDADLTSEWVAEHVVPLLTDHDRLAAMGAAAAHLIPLDADEKLARMILEAAR